MFLTCSDLEKSRQGLIIKSVAAMLNKKPIAIDEKIDIDWKSELTVNKKCYNNYRRAYIKTDYSSELPFWQIVADKLKQGVS